MNTLLCKINLLLILNNEVLCVWFVMLLVVDPSHIFHFLLRNSKQN